MKKILLILFLIIMLIHCIACVNEEKSADTSEKIDFKTSLIEEETDSLVVSEDTYNTEITSASEPDISRHDFTALELIGYHIDEKGYIHINGNWKNECDPDTYRKYFFGTWEGWSWSNPDMFLIIDDSQKNNCKAWLTGGIYHEENALIFIGYGNATVGVYWLDIDEPGIMYCMEVVGGNDIGFNTWYSIFDGEDFNISFLLKTDEPINQPENGYLSILRIRELSEKYNIAREMLTTIDDYSEYSLWLDEMYTNYPIYLISESPEELVLKSQLGQWLFGEEKVDIVYTIEKVNGEWVRTVEIDQEQLERIIEQL